MEVELPDGARIKRLVAYATRGGDAGTLTIKLVRQKIAEPTRNTALITVAIAKDADAAHGTEADVAVADAGPAANEEYRVVNNREHKYLLIAELDAIDATTTAQFHAFQIVCGR